MRITFKLYGYLPTIFPMYDDKTGIAVDVEHVTKLEELLSMIFLESSEIIAISSDGIVLSRDSRVHHSSVIRLFPVSSGG